jgi:hypothetical protein
MLGHGNDVSRALYDSRRMRMDAKIRVHMLNVANSIIMMLSKSLPSRTALSSLIPGDLLKKKKEEKTPPPPKTEMTSHLDQ